MTPSSSSGQGNPANRATSGERIARLGVHDVKKALGGGWQDQTLASTANPEPP